MSMFLGPIHHWLYNKIQLGAERSLAIEDAFKHAFGEEADPLLKAVEDEYPAFPTGLPLEDIIGDSPIHGFLQGLIRMVETREGALVKSFVENYGDKAKDLVLNAAFEEGMRVGEKAKGEIVSGDMESVFRALYDRQLDGMPCDQGATPEFKKNRVLIRQTECLHSNNWREAGAPLDIMCAVTGSWIKGFLKGASPELDYEVEQSLARGAHECQYTVSRA